MKRHLLPLGATAVPLGVLAGLNALDELDRVAFALLVPEVQEGLGTDLATVTTLVALVVPLILLLSIPVGFFGDRVRRTRLAGIGGLCWAFFSALTGLAQSLLVLGVARAGSGIGKTVNEPVHRGLLSDYYAAEDRPRVFAVHGGASNVGRFVGYLGAGGLAAWLGWRAPFLLFALPSLVLAVLALRLREPIRGGLEREAAGGDADLVATEEPAPSWEESWQLVKGVRTLRRLWRATPWLVGGVFLLPYAFSIYLDREFGLGVAGRGAILAFAEVPAVLGLAVGVPLATRIVRTAPSRIFTLLGVIGVTNAALIAGLALTPTVWSAVIVVYAITFSVSVIGPGVVTVISLVVPPRTRSFAYAIDGLYALPGFVLGLIVIGQVVDAQGARAVMPFLGLALGVGGALMLGAKASVEADLQAVQAGSLAAAESRRAAEQGQAKLLVCRDVQACYGPVQVLFGIDIDVDEGEIVALLGTNGAGKSTLLKAVCGSLPPSGGAVVLDGRDVTQLSAAATAALGMVYMPGGKAVFPTLSVQENLDLACWGYRRDQEERQAGLERVLGHFPTLRSKLSTAAGALSGGEQQMVGLGQALLGRPRLLLLDELSLGLAPAIVSQLLDVVRQIRDEGTTVVLVEQSVNVALEVADRAVFLEKGEVRYEGPTRELLNRPDIMRSVFLARATDRPGPELADRIVTDHVVLEVTDLAKRFGGVRAVDGVSLTVHEGEVVGLIGTNGAGKTTLLDLISGFLVADEGRTALDGVDISRWNPDVRALAGLGRSFQDARLFSELTVREAIAVACERSIPLREPLAAAFRLPAALDSEALIQDRVAELVAMLGLEDYADKFVGELSTGTRRIVDLAGALAHGPRVLLLDEPSSGVAQRETEELGPLLLRVAQQTGASLLVIEHDMSLIAGIADRLVALELGQVIAEGSPTEVLNHPRVLASYLGSNAATQVRSGAPITVGAGHARN